MSRRSVNLTTLFLGRLRPPKRLTSISCMPFLKKRKEKRKYVARPGIEPRTPDLRVTLLCPDSEQTGYGVTKAEASSVIPAGMWRLIEV